MSCVFISCKFINGVLKSERGFLYPRWLQSAAVIAGHSLFHIESNLYTTDFD